jgi:HSP20 family protein
MLQRGVYRVSLPSLFERGGFPGYRRGRRYSGDLEREALPGVNLFANDEQILVESEIPGVRAEDLSITVEQDLLTISFERAEIQASEGASILRRERPSGKFTRAIRLPYRAQSEKIEASLKNGVVTVRIPRAEAERPRKIRVN